MGAGDSKYDILAYNDPLFQFQSNLEDPRIPQEWSDDERMGVLFAPLIKPLNQDDSQAYRRWEVNIQFWVSLIIKLTAYRSSELQLPPIISIRALKLWFKRGKEGSVPLGLTQVLNYMISKNQAKTLDNYLAEFSRKGLMNSLLRYYKKYYAQLTDEDEDVAIIILPVLIDQANNILKTVLNDDILHNERHVYFKDEFCKKFKVHYLDLLLPYLSASVFKVQGRDAIKIHFDPKNLVVEKIDHHILILQNTLEHLEITIKNLEQQKVFHEKKALDYKKSNQIQLALSQMKLRKKFIKQIETTQKNQEILFSLKLEISNAMNNNILVEALKSARSALSIINKDMNAEQVEDLASSLYEHIEKSQEISESILNEFDTNNTEDEEEEYKMMLEDFIKEQDLFNKTTQTEGLDTKADQNNPNSNIDFNENNNLNIDNDQKPLIEKISKPYDTARSIMMESSCDNNLNNLNNNNNNVNANATTSTNTITNASMDHDTTSTNTITNASMDHDKLEEKNIEDLLKQLESLKITNHSLQKEKNQMET